MTSERDDLVRAAFSPHATDEESRMHVARLAEYDAAHADPVAKPASAVEPASVAQPPGAVEPPPAVEQPPAGPRHRPRRRLRVTAVVVAVVAIAALAFIAGRQFENHAASEAAHRRTATQVALERESPIGAILARRRVSTDLPLGYESGATFPFPGDSYRLLYDAHPGAAATASRWRVWIGLGADDRQLCVSAAYDATRSLTSCLSSTQVYESTATVVSPLGAPPLAVQITRGAVTVNGSRVSP